MTYASAQAWVSAHPPTTKRERFLLIFRTVRKISTWVPRHRTLVDTRVVMHIARMVRHNCVVRNDDLPHSHIMTRKVDTVHWSSDV